jgi:hypothetical protein
MKTEGTAVAVVAPRCRATLGRGFFAEIGPSSILSKMFFFCQRKQRRNTWDGRPSASLVRWEAPGSAGEAAKV